MKNKKKVKQPAIAHTIVPVTVAIAAAAAAVLSFVIYFLT